MLNNEESSKLKKAIKKVDAIFAFEGFDSSKCMVETDRAVLAGIGTYSESIKELAEYVKTHKTVDGFIYSKALYLK